MTSVSIEGVPNAAPIGLICSNEGLLVRLYQGSRTYTNVKNTGLLAANMVFDPVLFVHSALNRIEPGSFEFVKSETGVSFPLLRNNDAWVLFEVNHDDGAAVLSAKLKPLAGIVNNPCIRPINRAFNAIIEAAILATRYNVFKDETYLNKIDSYKEVVLKCGGSHEKQAYELILKLIL